MTIVRSALGFALALAAVAPVKAADIAVKAPVYKAPALVQSSGRFLHRRRHRFPRQRYRRQRQLGDRYDRACGAAEHVRRRQLSCRTSVRDQPPLQRRRPSG